MVSEHIKQHLFKVYGKVLDDSYFEKLHQILSHTKAQSSDKPLWSEKDVFLITYGDTISSANEPPLKTLDTFLSNHLKKTFSTIHILPFFPYSSDDGFAVKDFYTVNPDLGDWDHLSEIGKKYKLMADLVVNHASSQGPWFRQFLHNEEPGNSYFYTPDENFDQSKVVRPRSSPLVTNYQSVDGVKKAWTTFSADQVDLNYSNPMLLLEVINIVMTYIRHGVKVLRLDAIAFIWKKTGTSCVHQPETHEIVRLMRRIISEYASDVVLITETNVPHAENISYFGSGNEAHMVYQFPLPPLLLYTLNKGNATALTNWAKSLDAPMKNCTWFNFTASHDGIGVRPLEGLIPESETYKLVDNMINFGALVSNRRTPDGQEVPYEINITYYDALMGVNNTPDDWQFERFICSQTIMMSLQGVPAFYIQSMLGAHNDYNGAAQQLKNRAINRRKYSIEKIEKKLSKKTRTLKVFKALKRRIKIRKMQSAFHPDAHQQVLDIGQSYFAFIRHSVESGQEILCMSNITNQPKAIVAATHLIENRYDLITGIEHLSDQIILNPYQTVWLTKKQEVEPEIKL